jgi:hypothetical protein
LHCSVLHNSHQQAAPLVCAAASSAPKSTETTASVAAAAEEGKVTVSRKEKSLGKLCKRFLLAMEEESRGGDDVHLETVAKKMSECPSTTVRIGLRLFAFLSLHSLIQVWRNAASTIL